MGKRRLNERTLEILFMLSIILINTLLLFGGIAAFIWALPLIEHEALYWITKVTLIIWVCACSASILIQIFILTMCILDKEIKITGED